MFARIRAQNFFSWRSLSFKFEPGTTQITGWNHQEGTSEASGKSSILNALCFGLYGSTPKDVKTDQVIREGAKGCEVVVEFLDGHQVVRTRKPNDLYIIQPDGSEMRGKDARDTQLLIDALVGMSFETFLQSCYFAQNYPQKFITANEADKSKILAEILDLKVFDRARAAAAKRATEKDLHLALAQRDAANAEILVRNLRNQISDYERLVAEFQTQQSAQLARLEAGLAQKLSRRDALEAQSGAAAYDPAEILQMTEAAQAELRAIDARKAEISQVLGGIKQKALRLSGVTRQIADLQRQAAALHLQMAALSPNTRPVCPTCDRGFAAEEAEKLDRARAIYATQINDVAQKVDALEKERVSLIVEDSAALEVELRDLESLRKGHQLALQTLSEAQAQARVAQKEKDLITREINAIQAEIARETAKTSTSLETALHKCETELATCEANLSTARETLEILKLEASRMTTLKEAFREVRQYVFRGVLEELSRKTNGYLQELYEVPVSIRFSNLSEDGEVAKIEATVSYNGENRALGLYSGGQFRRLQLAVDLALSDLVAARSHKPLGLTIFDESMKDLSLESMERVLRVLEGRSGTTLIIEHNTMFKALAQRTFHVELVDGVSHQADVEEDIAAA